MNKKLATILLLALAARLVYFWVSPARPLEIDDAQSWDALGVSLAAGQGFVEDGLHTTIRPPVYPVFLAVVYKIFGHNIPVAKFFQILVSVLTCWIVFLLGKKIRNENLGLLSALFCALYPPLIVYSPIIASETLYIFLYLLSLLFLLKGFDEGGLKSAVFSGILLGLSHLCRPVLTFYSIFAIGLAIVFRRNQREIGKLLLMTALSFLVVSPWTVRNYRLFGVFIPVNLGAGQAFWLGSQIETGGRYVPREHPSYRPLDYTLNDVKLWEKANFQAGMENIKANPLGYLRLTARKFIPQWFEPVGAVSLREKSERLYYILLALHAAFILLSFWGLAAAWPERARIYPLFAVLLFYGVSHLVIFPMARFRLPFEPLLAIFAMLTLGVIYHKLVPEK